MSGMRWIYNRFHRDQGGPSAFFGFPVWQGRLVLCGFDGHKEESGVSVCMETVPEPCGSPIPTASCASGATWPFLRRAFAARAFPAPFHTQYGDRTTEKHFSGRWLVMQMTPCHFFPSQVTRDFDRYFGSRHNSLRMTHSRTSTAEHTSSMSRYNGEKPNRMILGARKSPITPRSMSACMAA